MEPVNKVGFQAYLLHLTVRFGSTGAERKNAVYLHMLLIIPGVHYLMCITTCSTALPETIKPRYAKCRVWCRVMA